MGPDDLEQISAGVRPAMAAAGLTINKMTIYSYFVNRWVSHFYVALPTHRRQSKRCRFLFIKDVPTQEGGL